MRPATSSSAPPRPTGPWELLEIGEPEVRPVPHPPFTDTTGAPGPRGVLPGRGGGVGQGLRPAALRRRRRHAVDRRDGGGDGRRRRRRRDRRRPPAVASDDRRRASQPARGRDRTRQGDRSAPSSVRGAAHGPRRARRRGGARPRHPRRRPRHVPRGRWPAGPRLHRHRPDLRPRPGPRPAADRRAELHAARSRRRSVEDRVRLRRHRQPAEGLGPMGGAGSRPHGAPRRPIRPRGGPPLGLRGLERGEPRRLLVRNPRGVPAPLRRQRARRQGGRRRS